MPSEQSRLLLEVPKVIAEELEPEPTLQECVENVEEGTSCSPKTISRVASDVSADMETNQTSFSQISESIVVAGSRDAIIPSQVSFCKSSVGGEGNTFTNGITSVKEEYGKVAAFKTHKQDMKTGKSYQTSVEFDAEDRPAELVQQKISSSIVTNGEIQIVKAVENEGTRGMAAKQVTASQVIELSDDEEAEDPDVGKHILEHPDSVIWYYLDPQGDVQGPFSMRALKRWSDANYFQPGFNVWKKGQIPDNSVFLSDMIGRIFCH
ncbi:hypothetical protein RJ639_007776 [Escallonia herrerae]|uniref:GYF domain-containing protein n=1 Tax=Escallonia herrerae TaxID=1293975 RepID=A0AA88VWF8_9ASTE|nr:hypothetical protein RJ639_007776 [Escallonia herrerae]